MKKLLFISIAVLAIFLVYRAVDMYGFAKGEQEDVQKYIANNSVQEFRTGDIIFHTSKSQQSKAIQLATHSKYSHMGIIYNDNGKIYVYEAVQPVKMTPINEWINRGVNGHYVLKRLNNASSVFNEKNIDRLKTAGNRFISKDYDIYFEWSDHKIYCSELVWKMYDEAFGIKIGELQKLSEFDLNNNVVKQLMKERYGDNIPMDEKVISPIAMFNSDKLITIMEK